MKRFLSKCRVKSTITILSDLDNLFWIILPLPEYEVFAKRHFEEAGKQIDDGVVRTIYERFDGTTWYLQKVLNSAPPNNLLKILFMFV